MESDKCGKIDVELKIVQKWLARSIQVQGERIVGRVAKAGYSTA